MCVWVVCGGEIGLVLFAAGIAVAGWLRRGGLFFAYLVAVGAFFVIVAEGNLDAPYRQLTSIPPLSAFVALGALAVLVTVFTAITAVQGVRVSRLAVGSVCLAGCLLVVFAHPLRRHHIVFAYVE